MACADLTGRCKAGVQSVVVHGQENRVECFLVRADKGGLEHVADWVLEQGCVFGLDVMATSRGLVVATLSASGVGWAWIDYASWTVCRNEFFELAAAPSSSQRRLSMGSVLFLHHNATALFTLNNKVLQSCEIVKFAQDMTLRGPLQVQTEMGKALAALNSDHFGETFITNSYSVSDLDGSVVLLCKSQSTQGLTVRWCEVGFAGQSGLSSSLSSSVSISQSVAGSGLAAALAKANAVGKNPVVSVLWEMSVPSDSVLTTEPRNNDGRDSRKLVYVASSQFPNSGEAGSPPLIRIYNVNGPVFQLSFSWLASPDAEARLLGGVKGMTVLRLPETDECSRRLALSLSVGLYLEVVVSDVSAHENGSFSRRASAVSELVMTPLLAGNNSAITSFLPCCNLLTKTQAFPQSRISTKS